MLCASAVRRALKRSKTEARCYITGFALRTAQLIKLLLCKAKIKVACNHA